MKDDRFGEKTSPTRLQNIGSGMPVLRKGQKNQWSHFIPLSHQTKTAEWQAATAEIATGSCPITACCRHRPVHTLLVSRKWKNIFHFHHQMNCCPVVGNSWDTVEKQLCTSCTTNILHQCSVTWRMYLNYVSTMSQLCPDSAATNVEAQLRSSLVRVARLLCRTYYGSVA